MMTCKNRNEKGFTLIEIIGVLAILAIMAGMLAPNLIQQIESARADAEEGNLQNLAAGLEASILATRIIPRSSWNNAANAGGWDTAVNVQTNIPASKIRVNDNGCVRRYWFDPNTTLPDLGADPYDQNTTDEIPIAAPVDTRAMIISNLSEDCLPDIYGGAAFVQTWDQTGGLMESPTLKIQRMNLSQLFEPVALLNRSSTQSMRRSFSYSGGGATPPTQNTIVLDLPDFALTGIPITVTSLTVNGVVTGQTINATTTTDLTSMFLLVDGDNTSGTAGDNFFPRANLTNSGSANLPGVCTASTADADVCPYTLLGGEKIWIKLDGFAPATGTTSTLTGYLDVTVTYTSPANWQAIGQSGGVNSTPVLPNIGAVTYYLINGTQIFLCSGTGGGAIDCASGDVPQLASLFIKESDSFVFSPGPPSIWGR